MKVNIPGHGTFWFLDEGDGTGPIAPLDHCDDEGNLIPQFPVPLSYAHVFENGDIKRFNKVIGHKDEWQVC